MGIILLFLGIVGADLIGASDQTVSAADALIAVNPY
jgi:hypothetical protein